MTTNSFYMLILLIAALVVLRRIRNMYRPIRGNGIRLLIPIIFFLPGLSIILNPHVQLSWAESSSAILLGVLLSLPLIFTTQYEQRENQHIYAKKNLNFVIAFIIVFTLRFILRGYFTEMPGKTVTALFMLVAISYVVPWRIISYIKFRKLLHSN